MLVQLVSIVTHFRHNCTDYLYLFFRHKKISFRENHKQGGKEGCPTTQEFNVNNRTKELCEEREFSYYELAKRSEIPSSTLNTKRVPFSF